MSNSSSPPQNHKSVKAHKDITTYKYILHSKIKINSNNIAKLV